MNRPGPVLLNICVVAALALLTAAPAQAREQCGPAGADGSRQCRAGIAAEKVRQLAVKQEQPQWCWAASISMIFAAHGYTVAQQEIVKDGLGIVASLPAPSGQAMSQSMSGTWLDDEARLFRTSVLASDARAKRFEITNQHVIAELAAGRPLLLGAAGHAVVLVGLDFERLPGGAVRITSGTVIDPVPGQGVRALSGAERRPTYVAAVQVIAIDRMAPADRSASAAD